jgi:hypothetical protein
VQQHCAAAAAAGLVSWLLRVERCDRLLPYINCLCCCMRRL